jgi:flagellar biogenesis protein FliO
MDSLFGLEMSTAGKVSIALVIVIALLVGITWAIRRFGADHFGSATTRGRQPRLAVVDAAAVDGRRKLVIVRRDNVEHLLMIGGPTDVLIESNIVRGVSAARDLPREAAAPSRTPPVSDTLARPVPLGEGSMWPLQPQPETSSRPQRPTEEPSHWTSPPLPESLARPPRPPETLPGLAEELSSRPPQPSPSAPRAPSAPEPTRMAPPPTEQPQPAAGADQNLADMAHRLEAALRGPNEPRRPEPAKSESKEPTRPAAPEAKPARADTKPAQPKALYDSLEQEMASLLGRPPGKT